MLRRNLNRLRQFLHLLQSRRVQIQVPKPTPMPPAGTQVQVPTVGGQNLEDLGLGLKENGQPNVVELGLDPLGRLIDLKTYRYVRYNGATYDGRSVLELDADEGHFLTLDSEGGFVIWQPPAGWTAQ